jgi:hypothetical protein
MQSLRKDVDKNSQGLQKMEIAVRGLQRRISHATDSLVRRIETIESDNHSHTSWDSGDTLKWPTQKGWCKDAIGRFNALEASIKDLQDCLHACNKDTLAQASSLALERQLHTPDAGHAIHPLDAPEACFESDPSHSMCLERLQERWDELQAAADGGDGAEPLDEFANGASTLTILQVGKTDSESGPSPGTMLAGVGHQASRLLVHSQCRNTQQNILGSVLQRTDTCDVDTRMANVASAESDTDDHFFSASVMSPLGRVKQEVVTCAEPVTPCFSRATRPPRIIFADASKAED